MSLSHYAFLILAPGYSPKNQRTLLDNSLFKAEILGVSSLSEAIKTADALIGEGVQLIELCGGFDAADVAKLIAELNTDTPIGHVNFSDLENKKLVKLLDEK